MLTIEINASYAYIYRRWIEISKIISFQPAYSFLVRVVDDQSLLIPVAQASKPESTL